MTTQADLVLYKVYLQKPVPFKELENQIRRSAMKAKMRRMEYLSFNLHYLPTENLLKKLELFLESKFKKWKFHRSEHNKKEFDIHLTIWIGLEKWPS